MQQKNTHIQGKFSALRRRIEVIVSVVLSVIIFAGPVEASTWKPTALVNTEAFQAIDDSDSSANVVLKFGDTLAKTLTYNRASTRFEFNDKVYVTGDLAATGTLSGAYVQATKQVRSSGSLIVGTDETFVSGASHTISVATPGSGFGNNLSVISSSGATGGNNGGGNLNLLGGAGVGNTGPGGNVKIIGGRSGNITAAAGNVYVLGGNAVDSGNGTDGSVYIAGGSKVPNGTVALGYNGTTATSNVAIRKGTATTALDVNGTISGATVYGATSLRSSGSLVWEGAASGATMTVGNFTVTSNSINVKSKGTNNLATFGDTTGTTTHLDITRNSIQVKDSIDDSTTTLYFNPAGGNVGINTSGPAKATLDVHGSLSGSSIFAGGSITGAGLTSCSNSTTSKLLWDSATGRFSCGTDQTGGASFGTGNVLTIGNQKYVSKQGDTMTGALTINMQGGTVNTIGAKIINTLSGAQIHAEKNLTSSGTILSFGNIITKGALTTSSFGHVFASGALMNELGGFNDMVNIQTGNLGTNSITRLTNNGNITNIGSIQSGEINATVGGTFATKVDYNVAGNNPTSIATSDLNGDGRADMAVATVNGTLSVFLNSGNGTFAPKVDYATTGNDSRSIVSGDLNGDGKPDLATANETNDSLSVLMNTGNGTFGTTVDYTTGDGPHDIVIGDLNGDGKPDLATSNYNTTTVSVFINNGNGTFAAKVDYTVGTKPISIALGDVNGDGKADLATGNETTPTVSVLVNKGNGTFGAKTDYTAASSPTGIAMGDLDGDGKADLVTTSEFASAFSVFINSGTGAFRARVDYTGQLHQPTGVAIGDINGDGKADVVAVDGNDSDIVAFINKGNGTFGTGLSYNVGSFPTTVSIADMNGDGKADLLSARSGVPGNISVLFNNTKSILYAAAGTGGVVGIGTSTPGSKLSVSGSVLIDPKGNIKNSAAKTGVALEVKGAMSGATVFASSGLRSSGTVLSFGNILTKGAIITSSFGYTFASGASITELSGFNDMVNIQTGNLGTKGVTRLDSNGNLTNIGSIQSGDINATGGGTFPTRADYTGASAPSGVAVGDMNGDGKADIAVANYSSTSVSVFINTGTGTFRAKVDYTTGTNPQGVAIGDVNGDGKADLAVTNNGSTSVSIFLNKGDGTFTAKVDYTTGTNPYGVIIGDVNGDGKADLAVANNGGTSASVFLNNGNGTFGVKIDYTTGTNPRGIAMGDVNGDGKADLAVANYGSNTASIFLNNGNGTFGAKTDYATATNPTSVAIGDLSGDGKADLAAGNEGSNSLSIYINTGTGLFAAKVDYSLGTGGAGGGNSPESIVMADLNGDGKTDIATASSGDNTATVSLNNGNGTFGTKIAYTLGLTSNASAIGVGDMNGDGKADLAVTSSVGVGLGVFLNRSKSVFFASTNTGGVVGIGTTTPGSTLSVSGSVLINRNGSMKNSAAKTGVALEVVGTLSGSSLVGAGLSSCSNGTTSKLLYDSATGKFSCGTDQTGGGSTFGSGNVLTIGNQKYVSKQGDTMTGTLIINMQGGNPNTIGAKILNTLSGAILHAEKTLASSGTLVWEGAGSGKSLTISDTASFSGPLTFGDAITDAITINAGAWTFANDTNFTLNGGVNGLSFDTNTFSVDATNDRIGIGTTAPKTKLEVVGTISGSQIRASNMSVSGAVVYTSGSTLQATAKGSSGQVLVSRATGAPEWKAPTGSLLWFLGGTLATGATQGAQVFLPFGFQATSVNMIATGAPTGAALIADIKQNGTTIFSVKPQINAASTTGGGSAAFSTTNLTAGSTLTLDLTQVGSTFAGSGLTLLLNGLRRY